MTQTVTSSGQAVARVLSEAEIQERLYGGYLGRRRTPAPPRVAEPVTRSSVRAPERSAEPAPAWTGQEILSGELNRLRSELILLRQEKERLQSQMRRMSPVPAPAAQREDGGRGGWTGGLLAFLLLVGALGTLAGIRVLQASPAAGEATPYTIQVAVYDVRPMADRAQQLLQELGYAAFLVSMPRADGRDRYRIYVGSYVTREEARQEYGRLTHDPRFRDLKDAFIRLRS